MGRQSTKPALVLVSDAHLGASELDRLRTLASEGATLISWQHSPIVQDRFRSPDIVSTLRAASIESITPAEALGEGSDFEIEEAVIAWMKELGRKSFRERFRWGPLALWWWAEIYLYHETPLRLIVRDVEALARLVERLRPERIVLVHPVRALQAAARNLAPEVEVVGRKVEGPPFWFRTTALHIADLLKMWGTGLKSLFRRFPRPLPGSPRVLFLTHASMWRPKRDRVSGEEVLAETYFDGILPAVAARAVTRAVAFGPPVPFRKRDFRTFLADLLELRSSGLPYVSVRRYFSLGLSFALTRDFLRCFLLYRELLRVPGLERALSHRGIPLGPAALPSFRDTFLRQFPWTMRSFREVERVLLREGPDVLVLYAESSGLGRAAVAAARYYGVASVAVQHGIMYPQYFSHEHRADELEGDTSVPIATRTAVFGSLAKELLVQRGSYPEERVVVTGSPKFDALLEAASGYDRKETRAALDVPENSSFLVLATRWSAVSSVFEELVLAIESLPGVFLFVKPHQAESPEPYREVLKRLSPERTRILPGERALLELLFASDGLITVDSFASSEALVLGRPVLVVGLPSNLGPLVDRGVALGVRRGESILRALERLLFDPELKQALEEKRKEYIQEFAFGADGRSTDRIVRCILGENRAKSP